MRKFGVSALLFLGTSIALSDTAPIVGTGVNTRGASGSLAKNSYDEPFDWDTMWGSNAAASSSFSAVYGGDGDAAGEGSGSTEALPATYGSGNISITAATQHSGEAADYSDFSGSTSMFSCDQYGYPSANG